MNQPAILIIHNRYRLKGGEDAVVSHETAALKKAGMVVYELHFNNPDTGESAAGKLGMLSGLFFNIRAYVKVLWLVKQKKVAVVHVHNTFYQASPSVFWAARHGGARVIATLHNYRLFCLNALFFKEGRECTTCFDTRSFQTGIRHGCFQKSRWKSFLLAASLKLHHWIGSWRNAVDRFIVINPLMEQYLVGMGIDAQKISFKPNFIPGKEVTGYELRHNHYLVACRLEPEKGIVNLLQAWQPLPCLLKVAGTGSLKSIVAQAVNHNIVFLGLLNSTQMNIQLASCRAVIFPSLWKEGMPLSILEAMASGAICIAQDSAATRLLVRDGITGFLFFTDGLGPSLQEVVLHFETMSLDERNTMAMAARAHFDNNFSINQHLLHIAHIYGLSLQWKEKMQGHPETILV